MAWNTELADPMGGQQRLDRRRDWWAKHRPHLESTILAS